MQKKKNIVQTEHYNLQLTSRYMSVCRSYCHKQQFIVGTGVPKWCVLNFLNILNNNWWFVFKLCLHLTKLRNREISVLFCNIVAIVHYFSLNSIGTMDYHRLSASTIQK